MIADYEAYVRQEPAETERERWRQQLLAVMAGERAELLLGLLGLEEATLTGAEIFEDYTARDLLAHIAAWDTFHQERMALALAGRADEITPIELHDHNAALRRSHQSWSLERSVAAVESARERFLETLAQVPDALLHRPVSIPWADTLPMRTWAIWRARHDAVHSADVDRWRRERDGTPQVGPGALLQAALAASREEMLALAALVAEGARDGRPLYGEWTLRDVVGHVADWEQFALGCLEAGEMLDMGHEGEVQKWNEAHAAARRAQPWAEVWEDYVQVRAALLALVAEKGESGMRQMLPNPWGRDATAYRFTHWFLEHEREHVVGLREVILDVPDA